MWYDEDGSRSHENGLNTSQPGRGSSVLVILATLWLVGLGTGLPGLLYGIAGTFGTGSLAWDLKAFLVLWELHMVLGLIAVWDCHSRGDKDGVLFSAIIPFACIFYLVGAAKRRKRHRVPDE